jgi:GPH family glycoside/pentoside/hexuronide:cation symporter
MTTDSEAQGDEIGEAGGSAMDAEEKLPIAVKLAYGAPGIAGAAMAIPIAIHLTIFYSDEILVPLGFIAIVKAVARAFDAITDPLMGYISDRTRSRWGRRRPWMVLGAPLAAISFVALFSPPVGIDPLAAAGWLAATYTLYYVFHTVYQIPHYGLGPEITQNFRERASLYGWSEGFSVSGTMVAAVAPWFLGRYFDSERDVFFAFSIAFGALLTLLYWNLAYRIRERPDYVNRAPNPLVPGVRRVMRNPAFRLLLVIYLVGSITGAIPGLLMPYFTKYVLQPDDPGKWLAIFLAVYFGSAFVCMPAWVWAVKRYGKKPIWLFSFASGFVSLMLLFFWVGEGDLVPMAITLIWAGSTFSARLLLGPAIQADVIDYDELHTGKRREAQYGGLWSIMTKFTVIPSMSVPLAVLASLGYEPNVQQSDGVQFAIRAIFALAPAFSALIGLALAFYYPINEDVHRRILDGIAAHRRGERVVDPLTGDELDPPDQRGVDEETGWFLDHFSRRELRLAMAGGSTVRGSVLWFVLVTICFLTGVVTILATIQDLETEPGLLAVLEIMATGVALASMVWTGIRIRAALRLRDDPPEVDLIAAHLASLGVARANG